MEDQKPVALLKEHFPTKSEVGAQFLEVDKRIVDLQQEMRQGFSEMRKEFVKVNDNLDELKDSAHALDSFLEKYPIERIERLESHAGLPVFVPAMVEE